MITGLLVFVVFAILVTVVYALGVRAVGLLYPRSDPRRAELLAERYKVPRRDRLFWVLEQFETAWFDGREARAEARRAREEVAQAIVVDPFAELVVAANTGDRMAIEHLIAALRPLIVRYCRTRVGRMMGSFSSADDIAQEVCIEVLTSLPSYRATGANFLSFVYGIANHKTMDFSRSGWSGQH